MNEEATMAETKTSDVFLGALSSIEDVIAEAKAGRMFILVDDENRENEGDLCIPAELATPEAINFMAMHGRGLICLALMPERVRQLGIQLMPRRHESRHSTAFTVSIEARDGVTTGISAHDRARTIEVAIDPDMGAADVVTPGHVFPLVAREGGTLVRAGHTEAVVDIARLAGFNPSGVICEIMKDDGTMARLPDLITFAQYHGLKVASIADLISYRRRTESIVKRAVESDLASRFGGDWRMIVYVNKATYAEHVALVKGNITGGEPVLVRMHAINVLDDVLGETSSGGAAGNVQAAMNEISAAGCGVLVLIREPTPTALSDMVRRRLGQAGGDGDGDDDPGNELRDYGVGAQILLDLGVREMTLLTNSTRNVVGLDGYGLRVVERRAFGSPPQGEGT